MSVNAATFQMRPNAQGFGVPRELWTGANELAALGVVAGAPAIGNPTLEQPAASWNLPATLNVQQNGTIGLRQYAVNATGWTISVSDLPAGVTYNAGLERLEGASTGTASGTATFTLSLAGQADVVDTATVSLLSPATGFTAESGFSVDILEGAGFVDGALIRITDTSGSDRFGTKPNDAKPYLWAPFDGSGNPSPLGVVTSWTEVQNMEYAAGEGVSGGGAFKASSSGGPWAARVDASGFAWNDYNQKMYLFRHVKRNFDITSAMNWKIIRLWAADHTTPDWYLATSNGRLYVEGIGAGSWTDTYSPSSMSLQRGSANVWRTDEFVAQANSNASLADGVWEYYVDGQVVEHLPRGDTDGTGLHNRWKVRESGSGDMVIAYPIHGVMANFSMPSDYRYWVDDVYLDTTWCRVLSADNSNHDSAKHEIAIPTAWSSSQVTCYLRQGGFASLSGKHIFVVDNNNTKYRIGSID